MYRSICPTPFRTSFVTPQTIKLQHRLTYSNIFNKVTQIVICDLVKQKCSKIALLRQTYSYFKFGNKIYFLSKVSDVYTSVAGY